MSSVRLCPEIFVFTLSRTWQFNKDWVQQGSFVIKGAVEVANPVCRHGGRHTSPTSDTQHLQIPSLKREQCDLSF